MPPRSVHAAGRRQRSHEDYSPERCRGAAGSDNDKDASRKSQTQSLLPPGFVLVPTGQSAWDVATGCVVRRGWNPGPGPAFRSGLQDQQQPHQGQVRRRAGLCLAAGLVVSCLLGWVLTSGGDYPLPLRPELSPSEIAKGESQLRGMELRGQPRAPAGVRGVAVRQIPRVVHQTYKIAEPPYEVLEYMQSWRDINPGYEFNFFDDEACLEFVRAEFPEYFDAYVGLPKDVERSDFFRYMVLLRYGGVYADMDTECRMPVDTFLKPEDTLVVGWENEWATQAIAFDHHFARRRQVIQWVIMAAPGHPVLREVCDFVAAHAMARFSNNTNRDTLERTGPGIWTDIVLRHAVSASPEWPIRILPRVSFGVNPKDAADAVQKDNSDIAVLHHFLGSWKVKGGWKRAQSITATIASFASSRKMVTTDAEEVVKDSCTMKFPVSAIFEPPFTVFVNLVGHGDNPTDDDLSSQLTIWGAIQPGTTPTRKPRVVDALTGALASQRARGGSLVDIGAGLGYFSLAAAARGSKVHSFELSPGNLELLHHSIDYNSFRDRMTVHELALGASEDTICVASTGALEAVQASQISSGYASAESHLLDGSNCQASATRMSLDRALSKKDAANIGVVRISANGWEGWILDGMAEIMEHTPPAAVLLEFHPAAIAGTGYPKPPPSILEALYSWGYTEISHSGTVCDERWHNITRSIRARGSYIWSSDAQEALKQPTWCRLTDPELFSVIADRAHSMLPENILLTHVSAPNVSATRLLPKRSPNATGSPAAAVASSDEAPAVVSAGGVALRGSDALQNPQIQQVAAQSEVENQSEPAGPAEPVLLSAAAVDADTKQSAAASVSQRQAKQMTSR